MPRGFRRHHDTGLYRSVRERDCRAIPASTASSSSVCAAPESIAARSVRYPRSKKKTSCYFPTAAAAAEAGFRPCLRCRPECSPGTPAWFGTSTTVSRALRLIGESGLEDRWNGRPRGAPGSRFAASSAAVYAHLGAPPSAVAHTRRLHFAKKLIDETSLSMTNVALASGFGCVRRFNAAIRKTYNRTPTQIRRLVHQKTISAGESLFFPALRYRPPYHWKGMLAFLAARAAPGVEAVIDDSYRRTISVNGCHGYFDGFARRGERCILRCVSRLPTRTRCITIIERIRRMFDLNADWSAIAQSLGSGLPT